MHVQGSACQCNVLHIIICKLGESLHLQRGDIKARKGEVRVEGTEELGARSSKYNIIMFSYSFGPFFLGGGWGGRGCTLDFK